MASVRFDGWIAGLGTAGGMRCVVGHWPDSPFGRFTDVMVERSDGHRVLLAPSPEVASFVAGTYRFDEVRIVPVSCSVSASNSVSCSAAAGRDWRVTAGPLSLTFVRGRRAGLGYLLRAVPRALASAPAWVSAVDVVARRVLPGVRTRGSAGGGREEYYAALDLHVITAASVRWEGVDQGALAPVEPPVRFGFGSTPRRPSLARIVTLVLEK
jgi:hypothetical protein